MFGIFPDWCLNLVGLDSESSALISNESKEIFVADDTEANANNKERIKIIKRMFLFFFFFSILSRLKFFCLALFVPNREKVQKVCISLIYI